MRRWEYVDGGSAKFWEAQARGTSVTVRFGRTGTAGQTRVKADAQSHLVKAIAEKERKGYAEISAAGEATVPAAPASVDPGVADGPAAPAAPVDEDAFTLPTAWKRNLYPRRGGVPCTVPAVDGDAPQSLRTWLEHEARTIERVLSSPRSDPALVEAARAHRSGSPNPLGAAVLALLLTSRSFTVVADAWAAEFGLPFAARAAAEMPELHTEWVSSCPGGKSRLDSVTMTPDPDLSYAGAWGRMFAESVLLRVRALLSVADEETYQAAVAGLAHSRRTTRQHVTTCFIAPSEQGWVEECCADPAVLAHPERGVRDMLLCSLGSSEQAALFDERGNLGWSVRKPGVVATVAEGIGVAMAPMVAGELNRQYIDIDDTKAMAAALVELPTDEAFRFLLARLDNKYVRLAVAAAARRYPARTLRLLAEASAGNGPTSSMAGQLLVTHVAAHRELALALLADLPEELAARVAPLARREGRVAEVPAESLPPLLTSPPWTRKRGRDDRGVPGPGAGDRLARHPALRLLELPHPSAEVRRPAPRHRLRGAGRPDGADVVTTITAPPAAEQLQPWWRWRPTGA